MAQFISRFQNAWNAFLGRDPTKIDYRNGYGNWFYGGSSQRPDRNRLTYGNEHSSQASITVLRQMYQR